MDQLLQSRATIIAGIIGVGLFIANLVGDYEIFESFISYLRSLERYKLDEAFLALCIILFGVVWDLLALQKQAKFENRIQNQRLHVLRATMVTVMDITNSLLASVRVFLYEVDAGKSVSTDEIGQLDQSMKQSLYRLKTLQELQSITEIELDDDSFAIDVEDDLGRNS